MNILVSLDGRPCIRQNLATFASKALPPSLRQKHFTGKVDKMGSCATSVYNTRLHFPEDLMS